MDFFYIYEILFLLKRSAVVHFKIYFCNVITTKKVRFGGPFYIYEILFLLKRSAVVHFKNISAMLLLLKRSASVDLYTFMKFYFY